MDFYISVSFPPFSDKYVPPKSPMQAALINVTNRDIQPTALCDLLQQHEPELGHYKVVSLAHHKRRPALPHFQHEFITLQAAHSTNENMARIHIRTCRHMGHPARDVVTVLGEDPAPEADVIPLRRIRWTTLNTAPHLITISLLILRVSQRRPAYKVFKSSCYGFSSAVFQAAHDLYGGDVSTGDSRCCTRRSRFLGIVSSGIREAPEWAREVVVDVETIQRYNTAWGFIASVSQGTAGIQGEGELTGGEDAEGSMSGT